MTSSLTIAAGFATIKKSISFGERFFCRKIHHSGGTRGCKNQKAVIRGLNQRKEGAGAGIMKNLRDLTVFHEKDKANDVAYSFKRKKKLVEKTFSEFPKEVRLFGEYFAKRYEGRHIGVYGENSYEWILTYFAVADSGNVIVPIDAGLTVDEVRERIEVSDCTLVVYSRGYRDVIEKIESDGNIVNENEPVEYLNMKDIEGIMEDTRAAFERGEESAFDAVRIDEEQVASIVYTSGTTGKAKGVVLTHKNIIADAISTCKLVTQRNGSTMLLLPLHHIYGMVGGVLMMYYIGYSNFINSSLKYVSRDIKEMKPQMLVIVPLFLESFYKKIMEGIKSQNKEKSFRMACKLLPLLDKIHINPRKKLFGKILDEFGGNLEIIISGGAPLAPQYVDFFNTLGIYLHNGYGITECASVISVNSFSGERTGSAGLIIDCCEVKISEEGEILVKGDNVLKYYYNMPEETEKSIVDGWYKTGDIGYVDADGYLWITGRIKNLIILSNGENISPEGIEEELKLDEAIEEVVVRGESNILLAEVYPNQDISPDQRRERVDKAIEEYNSDKPVNRQIQKIVMREKEFEKTTSKKIKR